MLNTSYFHLIRSEQHDDYLYQAYNPIKPESTMVLFSKNSGTPLISISFVPIKNSIHSILTSRPPPKGAHDVQNHSYMQGMLNRDEEEFGFVISNLTHFKLNGLDGYININILHTPHEVRETDPGPDFSINRINEIRPSESTLIECDMRNNLSLVLKGQKNVKTGKDLTVAVDEHRAAASGEKLNEGTLGTYFFISAVSHSNFPELVQLFAEGTVWRCVQAFVRKVYSPVECRRDEGVISSVKRFFTKSAFGKKTNAVRCDQEAPCDLDSNVMREPLPRRVHQQMKGREIQSSSFSLAGSTTTPTRNIAAPAAQPKPIAAGRGAIGKFECEKMADVRDSMFDDVDDEDNRLVAKRKSGMKLKKELVWRAHPPVPIPLVEIHETEEEVEIVDEVADVEVKSVDENQVVKTTTGKVVQGNRFVHVNSSTTGAAYNFDYPSQPMTLGLSIWIDMPTPLRPSPASLSELAGSLMVDFVQGNDTLIELLNKVYPTEECVICLEEDSSPDIIFLQCGHACVHSKCIIQAPTECLMCRSFITARIPWKSLDEKV